MNVRARFCSECGEHVHGKFCSACGHRVGGESAATSSETDEVIEGPWQDEVRYERLVRVPEVRRLIEEASRQAVRGPSGEDFLKLAEKLIPTPIPLEGVAHFAHALYKKWGIGTGKSREERFAVPAGEVLMRVLCSLARHNQSIRHVSQGEAGCRIDASLPSDVWSLEGDLFISIERRPQWTELLCKIRIGGQLFDWGKSKRGLDRLMMDVMRDPRTELRQSA